MIKQEVKHILIDKLNKLYEMGMISQDQMISVRLEHKKTGEDIEKILVNFGFIDEMSLLSITAQESGSDVVSLNKVIIDSEIIKKFPKFLAQDLCMIPLSLIDNKLIVAMSNVKDIQAKFKIKEYFGDNVAIVPVIASVSEILHAIDRCYDHNISLQSIIQELAFFEESAFQSDGINNPIIRLLDAIILEAVKRSASDIHFEPEKYFVRIRLRIDGVLYMMCILHKIYWNQLCVRLKITSSMDIADSVRPQCGRFSLNLLGREVDFRVSSHPVSCGENVVVRILDKSTSLLELSSLGYSERNFSIIKNGIDRSGMVIVTGPTGSGKTTSLYSMLSMIHSEELNVMTLEDPIEYEIPFIRQSSVHDVPGRSFADGLRSILRQDPDVIFVGEVRDPITAEMAVRSSMTGHQVFTTLHTCDAFSALFRLMDLGISPMLLASNINMVISQRLVRKLCSKCKKLSNVSDHDVSHSSISFNFASEVSVDYVADSSFNHRVCSAAVGSEVSILDVCDYEFGCADNHILQKNVHNASIFHHRANQLEIVSDAASKISCDNKLSCDNKQESKGYSYHEIDDHNNISSSVSIYEKVGCPECNYTGYKGRICISEVLKFDDCINDMLYNKKSFADIKEYVRQSGFISLKEDAWSRVFNGETSVEEISKI